MPEPHIVVLSDSSHVLIDKELRMEHADAELCKLSIGSPPDTNTDKLELGQILDD